MSDATFLATPTDDDLLNGMLNSDDALDNQGLIPFIKSRRRRPLRQMPHPSRKVVTRSVIRSSNWLHTSS